jgi:hypothetical protein
MAACSRQSSAPGSAEPPSHAALLPNATKAIPSTEALKSAAAPLGATSQSAATSTGGPQSESQSAALVAADETQGPFRISDQTFTFVKHIEKIKDAKSSDDSTVEWWELRDPVGKAVYSQKYGVSFQNGNFDDTEDVGARELKGKFGRGILVDGMSLPSAPNSGSWVQVFGLFNGKLVAFSSPISTEGEFLGEGVTSFQPSPMFRGRQMQPVSHDILKFRVWTGNFSIHYNVIVDWLQAKVRPEWMCSQMTSKGRSSGCPYPVEAESHRGSELTFVRLFGEPDEGFTPKHVVIKPDSKIEFVEAQAAVSWNSDQNNTSFGVTDSDKVWLHIKVDGQDGWIFGEEDFEAVGLPQAG